MDADTKKLRTLPPPTPRSHTWKRRLWWLVPLLVLAGASTAGILLSAGGEYVCGERSIEPIQATLRIGADLEACITVPDNIITGDTDTFALDVTNMRKQSRRLESGIRVTILGNNALFGSISNCTVVESGPEREPFSIDGGETVTLLYFLDTSEGCGFQGVWRIRVWEVDGPASLYNIGVLATFRPPILTTPIGIGVTIVATLVAAFIPTIVVIGRRKVRTTGMGTRLRGG